MVMRAVGPVGEPPQPVVTVATDPGVHGLAGHAVAGGDLNHRCSGGQDLHDGVIALLHEAQLHEHQPRPLHTATSRIEQIRGRERHPSTEASVSPIKGSPTNQPKATGSNFLLVQGDACGAAPLPAGRGVRPPGRSLSGTRPSIR
jgi:hypothetical protein